MPYGPDAIAFAASSSRQDFEPPPPGFEASSSQSSLVRPGLSSRRLDSSGSVVVVGGGDTQGGPSISESLVSEGEGAADRGVGTQSSSEAQQQPVIAPPPNASTPSITHNESTSPSNNKGLSLLPPANEFGKLYTTSSSSLAAPQDDSRSRSESRASNFSFQSYATAPESGYVNDVVDGESRPSTPRLGGRTGEGLGGYAI